MKPSEDVLMTIAQELVKYPERLSVDKIIDARGVLLTLWADASDMPILIGREGQMVNAIRVFLRSVGSRRDELLHLKILESI